MISRTQRAKQIRINNANFSPYFDTYRVFSWPLPVILLKVCALYVTDFVPNTFIQMFINTEKLFSRGVINTFATFGHFSLAELLRFLNLAEQCHTWIILNCTGNAHRQYLSSPWREFAQILDSAEHIQFWASVNIEI